MEKPTKTAIPPRHVCTEEEEGLDTGLIIIFNTYSIKFVVFFFKTM